MRRKKKKAGLNFFGDNKQHITLLVNHPDEEFISEMQLNFLSGILNACKLTAADTALFNLAHYSEISYNKISEELQPRIVLMFGILPQAIQLPFVIPEFQKQAYNNQVYLSAPSLDELQNNKELKQKLWINLKQIFSL